MATQIIKITDWEEHEYQYEEQRVCEELYEDDACFSIHTYVLSASTRFIAIKPWLFFIPDQINPFSFVLQCPF